MQTKINNTQIGNIKDTDVVISLYKLIEHSDNYSKISVIFWQYYRDETNVTKKDHESFTFKAKIKGKIHDDSNTKDFETAVPSKYLSNFQKILEIPLVNCKINLTPTGSADCVISPASCAYLK